MSNTDEEFNKNFEKYKKIIAQLLDNKKTYISKYI
mgnify:CR=1 FL=1